MCFQKEDGMLLKFYPQAGGITNVIRASNYIMGKMNEKYELKYGLSRKNNYFSFTW